MPDPQPPLSPEDEEARRKAELAAQKQAEFDAFPQRGGDPMGGLRGMPDFSGRGIAGMHNPAMQVQSQRGLASTIPGMPRTEAFQLGPDQATYTSGGISGGGGGGGGTPAYFGASAPRLGGFGGGSGGGTFEPAGYGGTWSGPDSSSAYAPPDQPPASLPQGWSDPYSAYNASLSASNANNSTWGQMPSASPRTPAPRGLGSGANFIAPDGPFQSPQGSLTADPSFWSVARAAGRGAMQGVTGMGYRALTGDEPNKYVNRAASFGIGMIPMVGTGLAAANTLGGGIWGGVNEFNRVPEYTGSAGSGGYLGNGALTGFAPDILSGGYGSQPYGTPYMPMPSPGYADLGYSGDAY